MLKKSISVVCLLVSLCGISFSQGTIPMNKKEFREGFTQGNLLMMEHFYDTALATFLHIRAMDTTNANVKYKIGVINLQTRAQKPRAERFLAQAITNIAKKYVEDEPGETQAPPLALQIG